MRVWMDGRVLCECGTRENVGATNSGRSITSGEFKALTRLSAFHHGCHWQQFSIQQSACTLHCSPYSTPTIISCGFVTITSYHYCYRHVVQPRNCGVLPHPLLWFIYSHTPLSGTMMMMMDGARGFLSGTAIHLMMDYSVCTTPCVLPFKSSSRRLSTRRFRYSDGLVLQ